MATPNVFNAKWLSDIELLDANIEQAEELKPENISKFFNSLTNEQTQATLTNGILGDLAQRLKDTIPWFLEQMPPLYLWSTSQKTIMDDVLEIISARVLEDKYLTERHNESAQTVTLTAGGEDSSSTLQIASTISRYPAKIIRLFTSLDKKLGLCEIYRAPYKNYAELSKNIEKKLNLFKQIYSQAIIPQDVQNIIALLDKDYLEIASVKQLYLAVQAVQYCIEHENSYVNLTSIFDEKSQQYRARIDLGFKNFPVNAAVENIIGIFNRYQFQVRRILANEISIRADEKYTIIHVVIANENGELISDEMKNWSKTLKNLKAMAYVDHADECSSLLYGPNPFSINESNLIRAMANWVHIFLTKQNPYYYSFDRVAKTILNYPVNIEYFIRYFRARFDPRFSGDRTKTTDELSQQLQDLYKEIIDPIEQNILKEAFNFLKHILKTNYFLISKGALSFRMDPKCLNKQDYPETPFGIFYIIGRNFRAFQVRYRDIARGGVRVVLPKSSGEYANALAGLFDEVNGLAYAQQLKNKDIPEGGSKCVMVVKPGANMQDAVKSCISSLLDLINIDNSAINNGIIDYYAKDEIIYLGPDENLSDELIVWIIKHALYRKYKYAYAFMSSKPDFGINHKTYGVTSEGLQIYVDNVLAYLGLDKATSFRVKMTGGPDGDVAGNEMKILYREYGERCRLVAVADGFGAAYDPEGLQWSEILRLHHANKSIVEFAAEKLSKSEKAFVISANTQENIKIRDNLFNSAEAEIFIPAGGRPYTVKETNWQKFLLANGKASAQAIVEGANIFFTKEARQKLVDSGVIIIKDSSANKAGVSCSSYEIIACLTITPEEFAEIKNIYVEQVLDIIRTNADKEAKLLFREWLKHKENTDLVRLSYEISAEINSAKDILLEKLSLLSDAQLADSKYTYVLYKHCPKILVSKYPDRIIDLLPRAHKIAILSAYMASHLVYKEGLHWLDNMHPEAIFNIALDYMAAERSIEDMIGQITASNLAFKDEIIDILSCAGARHLASYRL